MVVYQITLDGEKKPVASTIRSRAMALELLRMDAIETVRSGNVLYPLRNKPQLSFQVNDDTEVHWQPAPHNRVERIVKKWLSEEEWCVEQFATTYAISWQELEANKPTYDDILILLKHGLAG